MHSFSMMGGAQIEAMIYVQLQHEGGKNEAMIYAQFQHEGGGHRLRL